MRPAIRAKPLKMSLLVTAGPTREKIDPVRFISNYSTGTFGYRIAEAAAKRKWRVVLVSGPTSLMAPKDIKVIRVESALEMRRAVKKEFKKADAVIMAAAVSDWRPVKTAAKKIKKLRHGSGGIKLNLIENPDILCELGEDNRNKKVLAGFALETENAAKNAAGKLKKKNLDIIVINKLGRNNGIFGDNPTDIMIIDRFGNRKEIRQKTKNKLANIILDTVSKINMRLQNPGKEYTKPGHAR